MATYIGFNTTLSNKISLTGFHYVVDSSGISRSLVLLQGNPYSINGTNYVVYMIGGAGTHSLNSSWFAHLHNNSGITSTSNLPLDSQIIYATSNNVAFSPGNYPSGKLYFFSTTVQKVNPSNTWRTDRNPGGVAGTGTKYAYYNKQTSTVSSGKCNDYGFCPTSSYGVSIVELYHSTNGVANATGLYTSIINRGEKTLSNWSKGTYKSWIYDYYRESNTGSSYPARINGTGRKVFAIHNTTGGDCNLAIAYGGSTSAALSDTNYTIGSFGYIRVEYNTWAHHTTQGKHYYSTTVNKNNQFIGTRLQLEAGSAYTIKMHTYSEANYDGIVISTTKLTSASLSSTSTDGITRCSGVDKTVTYTLPSDTSTRTLYIYFKTDSSTLKGPGDVDSTGASINNSTISNYSTGDIEIYSDVYTITFNTNGGEGGTRYATVVPGESLNLNTITKPTRSGWSFYKWAIDVTSFRFVPDQFKPEGNVTLYAVWDNFPKFTELSDKSVYCTDDCIAASSTQGITFIPLFSGDGMTCSEGTVKYVDDKSKVYPVGSPNSPISEATIKPIGPNSYVKVPSGTPAGNYIASIVVYTSLSTKIPGSYYGPHSVQPAEYKIPFTIKATTLTYGPVELIQPTPDYIIEGDISQHKKFPAGSFTISPSTIGDYFTVYGVFRQVVTCNNGRVREGNLIDYGWLPGPYFSNIVVPSLGTTQTNVTTYTFTNKDNESLYYRVDGEGYKSFVKYVRSGVREANALTSLSASVGESSIYAGDKTFIKTKALFTSGDKVSVRGTYSGYDSSIINIDNNVTVICVDNVPDENDYTLEYSKIYYYYGQYNGNYLFKKMWEDGPGSELVAEYIVTDSNDFDVLLHASYEYNGYFTTPTHIIGRLNADMSDYSEPVDEVRILDVY